MPEQAPADDVLGQPERVPVTIAVRRSLKRTHDMFIGNHEMRRPEDPPATEMLLRIKMHDEYEHVRDVPDQATDDSAAPLQSLRAPAPDDATREALPSTITRMLMDSGGLGGAVAPVPGPSQLPTGAAPGPAPPPSMRSSGALSVPGGQSSEVVNIQPPRVKPEVPKPVWHPPWKLMRVQSGHEGWVRTVAVDPTNEWFASAGNDRLIKIWDLASGTLKISLTGHINTVRGVAISDRHPYLFSVSEDCEVKCWDLEQNMVIRNYHGHLSGVYSIALHPTLNILATGGRDAAVRIWDMRTKAGIFVFSGHTGAVCSLASQAAEPQFISGSMDHMVRLWDLAAGKCAVTLTNHKKSVRAIGLHPTEYTFVSCSSDNNKVWKCPKGAFERNISGHGAIVNACAVREAERGSSILMAGTDNGYLNFWDWRSGYKFQSLQAIPQPGSMSAENGIFDMTLDKSGSRLITAECDKTVKIYREDPNATPETHPLNWKAPKMSAEQRY
mmetsp:Transcript_81522/g.239391  ORF Transcript_81522/g.239391 Transcript_81522/m.239391 type:complete len:499 (-) Transcript_81522:66-1562(-)